MANPTVNFRDRLGTIDDEGNSKKVYPKRPKGRYYNARTVVSWFLLLVLFGSPFLKINEQPVLLLDIINRKFVILGQIFWPQDFYIFGLIFITLVVGIILFTVAFGRIFCGWLCPQTIFLEMVFRKIEYLIEGDHNQQKALDKAPWDNQKTFKKGLKHSIFFVISFFIANTFLSYIIGVEALYEIITDSPSKHLAGLFAITLFSFVFYFVFAKFREQACIIACPYGRLQGVLLDKDSVVIAYDHVRGEPRGKLKKNQVAQNQGDCIDCSLCVQVCPTGIDIRNGTQLECVNCTACIDVCDDVMDKIAKPRGLIRYDSLKGIEEKKKFKFTPRMIAYSIVLMVLLGAVTTLLLVRKSFDATILRAQGVTYQRTETGNYKNLYNYKIINKTAQETALQFRLIEPAEGKITLVGEMKNLPPEKLVSGSFFIELPPSAITKTTTTLKVGMYNDKNELVQSLKVRFTGPILMK